MISKRDLNDLRGRVIEVLQDKLRFQRILSVNRNILFEEARSLSHYFVEYSPNPRLATKTFQSLFAEGSILPGYLPNEVILSPRGRRLKVWRP
jgi:hypothetical protein